MPSLVRGTQAFYRTIARPVCFLFDSEPIHDFSLVAAKVIGAIPGLPRLFEKLYRIDDSLLRSELAGIPFPSPVGLAAGFDTEARMTRLAPGLGFGFESAGTVTHGAYGGNEYPRIKRAVRSRSILVNKGFKSRGIKVLLENLKGERFRIPVGISIGPTNKEYTGHEDAVADIRSACALTVESSIPFAYMELNISCPNLKTPINFYHPARLDELLRAITSLPLRMPLFIKMPITLSDQETLSLIEVIGRYPVAAIIIGNLQHDRTDPAFDQNELKAFANWNGNWGGLPCQRRSDELIRPAYRHAGSSLPIIGCGGIFTAEDAYRKIRLGASLVQLASALIFEGPLLPSEINAGLVQLLKQDGFASLSEAVGADHRAEARA